MECYQVSSWFSPQVTKATSEKTELLHSTPMNVSALWTPISSMTEKDLHQHPLKASSSQFTELSDSQSHSDSMECPLEAQVSS